MKRPTHILRPLPNHIYLTPSNTPVECLSASRRAPSHRFSSSIRYADGFIIHNFCLPLYRASQSKRLAYYQLAYRHLADGTSLEARP